MRVVMDDAGDIPAELVAKHNIHIVPINISFGTEEFLSGITMTRPEFYEKAQTVSAQNFPKTSQPNQAQFQQAYESVLASGETEILTVTISAKLSKTYDSAAMAMTEMEGRATFHLFDSFSGSAGQGYMALEAARMAEAGASMAEIMPRLEQMRREAVVFLMIDSLEYALKGGRVSSMRSMMASLLNIKPIMELVDGEIIPASRVRTYNKALDALVDSVKGKIGGRKTKVAVVHANSPGNAQAMFDRVQREFDISEGILVDLTIPVAINLGPGALGIIALPEA